MMRKEDNKMGKRVFVSADWKESSNPPNSCDTEVVNRIRKWENDGRLSVEIDCTDDVHDTVLKKADCRRCDIKGECGSHVDWSSTVIFVVGDNTATKVAGACDGVSCSPAYSGQGKKTCKYLKGKSPADNIANGCGMSYLRYEITKAALAGKSVIIVFNSMYKKESWIPSWYTTLLNDKNISFTEKCRVPFWKDKERNQDCYQDIKGYLQ